MTKHENNTRPKKPKIRPIKRKAHPNSLANLIPPVPRFTSENQPSPESKSVPKRATRAEVFGAFLEKQTRDPRTGEETNRLAIVMAKAWRMFMEGHGEDDVKPTEFLAFCQFSFDGYFGKQGEKLTLEDDRVKPTSISQFSKEDVLTGIKHGIFALDIEGLELVNDMLQKELQKKRSENAVIINQT